VKKTPTTTGFVSEKVNRSQGGGFSFHNAKLYLSDGAIFDGQAPSEQRGSFTGEVVFNTGMTGYVESLTDPSYKDQILVFTYPLIGNYGVALAAAESNKIQVAGVVVSEAALNWSHAGADRSLLVWLRSQNIPILIGADTRALTKHLRTKGVMIGAISTLPVTKRDFKLTVRPADTAEPTSYQAGQHKKVILVDCGAKGNILRSLLALPVEVKVVPADYDYTNEDYDGILYSNGPGDPTDYKATVRIAKKALKHDKPTFGICLGSQIMGLAAGAKTYKLRFGHRGHNQPCMEDASERCYITSQNHGYALDEKSLPKGWRVSFRNLNDGSVEGIAHTNKPFFAVQFHPEACPGPTDTAWLFDKFYKTL
jgi:carbamoyl-phosphate synthase small subunit